MIILQQAFYGRDRMAGYRLLGSSDSRFDSDVEALCTAVGTPDGSSKFGTFHMSAIRGDYRYMISVSPVQSGDGGRRELFFHVYVGLHRELLEQHFGLADLLKAGAFETRYGGKSPTERSFSGGSAALPSADVSFVWKGEKFAISSRQPQLELMSGLLRDKTDRVSWASFAFRPLDSFDAYVISEFSPQMPGDRIVRNERGEVQSVTRHPSEEAGMRTETEADTSSGQVSSIWRTLFFLSLLVNVAAFFMIGIDGIRTNPSFATSDPVPANETTESLSAVKVPVEIPPEKMEEIREEGRLEFRDKLRREFKKRKTDKTVDETTQEKFKAYVDLYNKFIK